MARLKKVLSYIITHVIYVHLISNLMLKSLNNDPLHRYFKAKVARLHLYRVELSIC